MTWIRHTHLFTQHHTVAKDTEETAPTIYCPVAAAGLGSSTADSEVDTLGEGTAPDSFCSTLSFFTACSPRRSRQYSSRTPNTAWYTNNSTATAHSASSTML